MDKGKLRGIASYILDEENKYTKESYTYDDFFKLTLEEQRIILDMINWVSKQRHSVIRNISPNHSKEELKSGAGNDFLFPIGEA